MYSVDEILSEFRSQYAEPENETVEQDLQQAAPEQGGEVLQEEEKKDDFEEETASWSVRDILRDYRLMTMESRLVKCWLLWFRLRFRFRLWLRNWCLDGSGWLVRLWLLWCSGDICQQVRFTFFVFRVLLFGFCFQFVKLLLIYNRRCIQHYVAT